MTAKEVLEKHSNKLEQGDIIKSMKEYARQKCKEQREICAADAELDYDYDGEVWIDLDTIEHAPEPEFE